MTGSPRTPSGAGTAGAGPQPGMRAICARCGRTVWLRKVGTIAASDLAPAGTPAYHWVARKGSKPSPLQCPVSDGHPMTYHAPAGQPRMFYGDPADPIATR